MKKPCRVNVRQMGKVFVMPKTLFAETANNWFNTMEAEPPWLTHINMVARPDGACTVVALRFILPDSMHLIGKDLSRQKAQKFVSRYNSGMQSFGYAEIQQVKSEGTRQVDYLVSDVIEGERNVHVIGSRTLVYLKFNHKSVQLSFLELI